MKTNLVRCVAVFAALLLAAASVFAQPREITSSEKNPEKAKEQLLKIIAGAQQENVKDSFSDFDCFTKEDYDKFRADDVLGKIAIRLQSDPEFVRLSRSIAVLEPADRSGVYNAARKSYKKTWKQLGGKPRPEGQTEDGQKAEKEIAERIAQVMQSMVEKGQTP